jgi:leucyl-tRNA---protein transferase
MARLLQRVLEPPHPCVYLPEREAQLDLRVMVDVSAAELETLLERGWRRFGPVYFRPVCTACDACITLRVPADTFAPSKSQRRARRASEHLTRAVGRPMVDDERLALYARWHAEREAAKGWEPSMLDAERYAFDFAFDHPSVREVAFRDGDRLVGLGIVDETPRALSAVYFFWDPETAPSSLGTAHVMRLVEDAKARGLAHVYLGYRVEGCASLAYKSRFRPHELLEGRPAGAAMPRWKVVSDR